MSVDGFVSTGPNDEQHWVTWAWDEIRLYVLGLLDSTDTILIGRKLAVDYIPYWQDVNTKPMIQCMKQLKGLSVQKRLFSQKHLINPNG